MSETPMTPELPEEQIEALVAAGNRAWNDSVHEDLCACDAWPEECLSSGGFFQGFWDMGGLETAVPVVLALWERMRDGELERLRAWATELKAQREADHATWQHDLRKAQDEREAKDSRISELEAGIAWRDAELDRWMGVHNIVERAIDKGWSSIDTAELEDALGVETGGAE
ncbi:hypothetical protein ACWEG1_05660 [Streptomyces bauhiniae]